MVENITPWVAGQQWQDSCPATTEAENCHNLPLPPPREQMETSRNFLPWPEEFASHSHETEESAHEVRMAGCVLQPDRSDSAQLQNVAEHRRSIIDLSIYIYIRYIYIHTIIYILYTYIYISYNIYIYIYLSNTIDLSYVFGWKMSDGLHGLFGHGSHGSHGIFIRAWVATHKVAGQKFGHVYLDVCLFIWLWINTY